MITRGRPVMDEEQTLGQIRDMLRANGARVFRAIERVPKCYRCGIYMGSSEDGTPDISGYFYKDGFLPFWFEIKRSDGKGRVRAGQLERIVMQQKDGCCAGIVKSWEEVVLELAENGRQMKVL